MIKANITLNGKQVTKKYMSRELTFDNAIQRGFVWDVKRSSLFIDSMLRNYPTPPIYTIKGEVEDEKGKVKKTYDCLDGKQRCTTIARFRNNEFKLRGLDPIVLEDGTEYDLNGDGYDDLPEELQDAFDSYTLTVYFFTDIDEEEITEMMSRLNNGKAMTGYENLRIKAADLDGIKELASHPLFEKFSATQIRNYANEDIVVKIHIMLNVDKPCLDSKVVKPYAEKLVFNDKDKEDINWILDKVEEIYENIALEDKAIAKRIIQKTHLLSIVPYLFTYTGNIIDLSNKLLYFFDGEPSISKDYNANVRDGANHAPQIEKRVKAVKKELDKIKLD